MESGAVSQLARSQERLSRVETGRTTVLPMAACVPVVLRELLGTDPCRFIWGAGGLCSLHVPREFIHGYSVRSVRSSRLNTYTLPVKRVRAGFFLTDCSQCSRFLRENTRALRDRAHPFLELNARTPRFSGGVLLFSANCEQREHLLLQSAAADSVEFVRPWHERKRPLGSPRP